MDKKDWDVELTPARPAPRSAGRDRGEASADARLDQVLESIDKLSDLIRRVEAKLDVLDERMTAVARSAEGAISHPGPAAGTEDEGRDFAMPLEAVTTERTRVRRRIRDASTSSLGGPRRPRPQASA